jgi:hypothetical protein
MGRLHACAQVIKSIRHSQSAELDRRLPFVWTLVHDTPQILYDVRTDGECAPTRNLVNAMGRALV